MSDTATPTDNIFLRRQRWGKILLAVATVVLLLLSLLPVGIRMGAVSWLEDHGVKDARIDNVDLNLFSGTFAIEGVSADGGLKIGRLFVDVDWWPMFSKRAFVRSVEVKGVKADVEQQKDGVWQLSTIVLDQPSETADEPENVEGEAPQEPWQVVLNRIDIADVKLHAKGQLENSPFELSLPIDSLNITLKKVAEGGAQLLNNSVRLGKTTFNGLGYQFNNAQLTVDQSIFLPAMGSDIAAGLKLEGMKLQMGGLSLRDTLRDVQLVAVDTIKLDQVNLSGMKSVTFDLLSIEGIGLPKAGKDSLGTIGRVSLHQADLDLSGDYRLKKIAVDDIQASLKKLKSGQTVVLDRLLSEVDTKERPAQTTSTESKQAESGSTEIEAAEEGVTAPKPPVIYVEEFTVGEGSQVSYRDESLFPPFDTTLQVKNLSLAPVDVSGKERGKLDMLFKLNKNGSLAVGGDVGLNPKNIASDLKVALKNFDMPGLTGFVEGDFGQSIKTGQFNLDSTIKVANNVVDAKSKLLIRRLTLEKAKQPGRAEASLGMPVDMALDMLRDDRGDIKMDVPITGHLNDPNVNVGDVINKALVSSMSAGAMTYAKLVLQPYGAILMAAEFAVGAAQDASKPKLTPIQFTSRSTELSGEMADYAAKISELMKSKDFRLEICGVATRPEGAIPESDGKRRRISKPEDLQPLTDEALLKIGESRSDAVMKAIQGHGVAADRLFNCRPKIDEKAGKKNGPRVELILD